MPNASIAIGRVFLGFTCSRCPSKNHGRLLWNACIDLGLADLTERLLQKVLEYEMRLQDILEKRNS